MCRNGIYETGGGGYERDLCIYGKMLQLGR